jgi:hypothetical protein
MVKKIFLVALVGFLVFFVAYRPLSAATVARWLGGILQGIATGFGDFLANLVP